ncbi:hypothetical protein MPSEU_000244000 [Mayamaea pseudoterrestris]|nr:hypothetical protein MPSEU_000244000 [Mayamaea pseudoterrestris]
MKGRFDSLDTTAMVAWMQRSLIGRRIVNIYDGDSGDAYIFKLDGDGGSKTFFLIESGIRFHSLNHFDAGSTMPSPFCAKLRKHLRSLRLEDVQQLGYGDRVVLFQFGVGPSKHTLILELYAKGNIILTNGEYSILSLLRSHVYRNEEQEQNKEGASNRKDGAVAVQVGHVYPVSYATTKLEGNLQILEQQELQKVMEFLAQEHDAAASNPSATGKKKKQKAVTLKSLLLQQSTLGVSHYGPALIEHCILFAELDPNAPLPLHTSGDNLQWVGPLRDALATEGPAVMQALERAATVETPGYILYKAKEFVESSKDDLVAVSDSPHTDKLLEEFVPHLLKQHEDRPHLVFDNFSLAVADFFAHIVTQRRVLKSQAAEVAAGQKLDKVRRDQQERLEALQLEQELVFRHAKIVHHQADLVEKALTVINSALDSGMDWEQLESLVEHEQSNGNPIALLIQKLLLQSDEIVLELPSDNLDPVHSPKVSVTISLKLSAHANANALFDKYRASKEKAEKTVEASVKALAAAEESAKRQLLEAQKRTKHTSATTKRKPLWFEKFHYFVTSENYLVVGGRDAHQNEQLVKRYLRPGDAYLHADVFGAASCILRAKRTRRSNGKTEPIPLSDQALREAGNFTICRSSAWISRMVTSAWWVEAHQVSKTAPTGEYLTVGSFMIRGKKNFLPPTPLEMGLAVLFRVSDDDVDGLARHKNERRDFALMAMDEDDDSKSMGEIATEASSKKSSGSHESNRFGGISEAEEMRETEESVEYAKTTMSNDVDATNSTGSHHCAVPAAEMSSGSDEDESSEKQIKSIGMVNEAPSKKGLSVRDRKLIRKYGSLAKAAEALEVQPGIAEAPLSAAVSQETELPRPVDQPLSRGKKAKLKRAMKKYADQDEEDKELAMLALQGGEKKTKKSSSSNKTTALSETQLKAAKDTVVLLQKDSSKTASHLAGDDVRSILAECVTSKSASNEDTVVRWDKFDARTLETLASLEHDAQLAVVTRLRNLMKTTRIDNFSASLGGILRRVQKHGHENLNEELTNDVGDKAKRMTKDEKSKENARWKQALADEGVANGVVGADDDDLDGDAVDDTVELSKLTGKPQPEDLLLYAIPVCGPYQTLSQYSYKVKLTPGSMKRGKAAKQCIEMFLKQDGARALLGSDQYLSLIKKVGDNDWLQNICADVKISAPGASKLFKQQKSKAKKKNK